MPALGAVPNPSRNKHALYLNTTLSRGIILILQQKMSRTMSELLDRLIDAMSESLNRLHAVVFVTAHEGEEEAPRGRRKRKLAVIDVEAADLDELLLPVAPPIIGEEMMLNVASVNEITLADTFDYAAAPPTFDDNFDAPTPNHNVRSPPSFTFASHCCRT